MPAHTTQQYPGINDEVQYSEGLFVGYRHYDAQNITPLFPFGHGLSYTSFSYSDLFITPNCASPMSTINVEMDIKNTGSRTGAETVQLYLGMPSTAVAEPPKQLKGFQKVSLAPGQSQHVSFSLDPSAFSYWNTSSGNWAVQNGTYQILVGSSSRDIRLQGSFTVPSGQISCPVSMSLKLPSWGDHSIRGETYAKRVWRSKTSQLIKPSTGLAQTTTETWLWTRGRPKRPSPSGSYG